MKAIVYDRYGPPEVLQLREIEKPAPHAEQVLVRVRAASLNPYDWHYMRGKPYLMRFDSGLFRPKFPQLGADAAGEVVEVGANVTHVRPGDEVFGEVRGAFAEYCTAAATLIAMKPRNLTWEQAAAVPMAGMTALQGLRDKGQLQPGQRVLINGASGGVGTFAVQIGKALGARVTGVCSTRNIPLVRSLGADEVIDYTCSDFVQGAQRYDLMLDLVGNRTLRDCRRALTDRGRYVLVGGDGDHRGPLARFAKVAVMSRFVSQTMTPMLARPNQHDLIVLREMIESGQVTPVLDRTFPLLNVTEAIQHLETRRARGKIVISVLDEK